MHQQQQGHWARTSNIFSHWSFGSFVRYWTNLSKVGDMINIFNLTNFVPNPSLFKRKILMMQKYDDRITPWISCFFKDFSISCSIECRGVAKSLVRKLPRASLSVHRNEMIGLPIFWLYLIGWKLHQFEAAHTPINL